MNMQIKVHNVFHFGSAQCTFVQIRWCTRRFCMFAVNFFDGIHCSVFSLGVCESMLGIHFVHSESFLMFSINIHTEVYVSDLLPPAAAVEVIE